MTQVKITSDVFVRLGTGDLAREFGRGTKLVVDAEHAKHLLEAGNGMGAHLVKGGRMKFETVEEPKADEPKSDAPALAAATTEDVPRARRGGRRAEPPAERTEEPKADEPPAPDTTKADEPKSDAS